MRVESIRFYQFRNICETKINLYSGLNILVGNNGVGKTNFIEGICLCLSGNSFRYGENADLPMYGKNQSMISLKLSGEECKELKVVIENGRKSHFLNNKKMSTFQICSQFPVILFSPESLESVKQGNSERRDLIDQFLLSCPDLNYQSLINEFTKVLKSKNKTLKNYAEGKLKKDVAVSILESYEKKYLELSTEISFSRVEGFNNIIKDLNYSLSKLVSKPTKISVEYLISDVNAMHYSKSQINEMLKKRLYELKLIELSTGHSLVGPQKHEVKFMMNDKDSRIYCSQGQQRVLILAFKLAHLMYHTRVYGIVPILFLDDVLSELDGQTRANLVKLLNITEGQVFITTTDRYLCRDFTNKKQKFLLVEAGEFSFCNLEE